MGWLPLAQNPSAESHHRHARTMMIRHSFLIPTYVILYRLGWVPGFKALIIPGAVSVYSIFLLRQFIRQIPTELVEAARLDGASEMGIFTRVILPMSRPALGTVAILTFMGSWNDFFGPLLYLNNKNCGLCNSYTSSRRLYSGMPSKSGRHSVITAPLFCSISCRIVYGCLCKCAFQVKGHELQVLLTFVFIVVGLFTPTLLVAWFQSQRLSNQYFLDAESAYNRGEYLQALTGYEEYDEQQGKYIQRGGYQQVEKIWIHPYAWPRPTAYARARERIQEIIDQRLTIAMAEAFVQANIGKQTPYLGIIYLRLGELYEESGTVALPSITAAIDFFRGRTLSRANDHLIVRCA
jgi:hypothetical protein